MFDYCYILHGCPPSEAQVTPKEKRWMNWLATELTKQGLNTTAPDLPTAWEPIYTEWKQAFELYPVNHNTLLIGHSCGAAFLVRWLAETRKKVKKLILVAPAKIPETETDRRKDLYNFEIPKNGATIADEIVLFTSNDFPHHLQSRNLYVDALNPRVQLLENKGHFLFFQMGSHEFPELLKEVLDTDSLNL